MATCTGAAFAQFLIDQQPHYDKLILETVAPTDGWIGHVSTGTQEAGVGNILYQDRMEGAYPDVTQAWVAPTDANCAGMPCDPNENELGYGATRRTYTPLMQSWASDLFCYDQLIPISHVKPHLEQIIGSVLKPATNTIVSNLLKKQALLWADTKIVANGNMANFTYAWVSVGTSERFLDVSILPTSLLLPQMLQRQYQPLVARGYFGKNPYAGQEMAPIMELVTDMDTAHSLGHLGGSQGVGGPASIAGNWRFENFDVSSKYWRYGLSGQVGNFAVRVDIEQLRFNFIGASGNPALPYRLQVVLPFKNIPSSGAGGAPGIKRIPNPDYFTAQIRLSFIWHKRAMEILTQQSPSLNSQMPFMKRDFGGKWFFAMDNLTDGCDVNGNPIAVNNTRRNKGKFIADFRFWIRPLYTEYAVAILHLGESMCFVPVAPCATASYATQSYGSANNICVDGVLTAPV